ncbi:MAG: EthD domain-containing protein [Deltaproteobacteria bacterium]|nr:EthD domain-containing protein [Deltaproteobacteria bacterium]MBV8226879.1 EthD domain-containing protein [Verrucomicrobiota bacterium]
MIRLIFVLRRKPSMSREQFQKYWHEVHGPLVAKHATNLNILRYVQDHTLEDPMNQGMANARGGMEAPYDGVAELWWTTREALATSFASPAGQSAAKELLEDEARFIDLPKSPLWLAYEYPQINPSEDIVARPDSGLVKIFFPLRHPPNQTLEQAQLYWRTNHGPIIRGLAGGSHLKKYFQVHRFEDPIEQGLRADRGTTVAPYTGHAEAWIDRAESAAAAGTPEARRAGELAVADEANFIDFRNSSIWVAKERVVIDRR